MARNAFQSWLLRTRIKCDILFDPEKLDPDAAYEEPASSVNHRFSKLPESQQAALRAYFSAPRLFPVIPVLRVYKLSDKKSAPNTKYGVHWEYDQMDRRVEAKRLALSGFDLAKLEDTYYTFTQLREFRRAFDKGLDVEPLLDNRYNRFQLMVLAKAMSDGYDISEYADPRFSASDMASSFSKQIEDHYISKTQRRSTSRELEIVCNEIIQEQGFAPMKNDFDQKIKQAQERAKLEVVDKKENVIKVEFKNTNDYSR